MRTVFSFIWALFLASQCLFSQVTIWSDNFNNGCASNCLATTWNSWTLQDNVGGVSGGSPNNWFVSCAEEGVTPPGCGSTCIGDASLHIGADPGGGGDMGSTFNETGAANATFRRVVSPTISTVGVSSTITLAFDFIAFGSSACSDDRAQLHLSTDNGATWPVGFQYCLTSVCCGACNGYSQGQWTTYTLALPAAFNNNPNVKIGFHWRNNGNGSGTDPSVAIDDIRLTRPGALPVSLMDFEAFYENHKVKLHWASTQEVNVHHYEIEKSMDGLRYSSIGNIPSKGNSQSGLFAYYSFFDPKLSDSKVYYRLRVVDIDGSLFYSKVIEFNYETDKKEGINIYNIKQKGDILSFQITSPTDFSGNIEIYNMEGKKLLSDNNKILNMGTNYITMPIQPLTAGVFILKVTNLDVSTKTLTEKFVVER